MKNTAIARRIVFLVLFLLFMISVIDSCRKWYRGDIGTIKEKDQAFNLTYPSFSLCLLLNNMNNSRVSKNEKWMFPNSTIDRLIEVKQKLLKNDR